MDNQMQVIKNIQTAISGDDIGSLVCVWDMNYYIQPAAYVDEFLNMPAYNEENRSVAKIHSVEYQIFDKVGIDITEKILTNKLLLARLEYHLLDKAESYTVEELENKITV